MPHDSAEKPNGPGPPVDGPQDVHRLLLLVYDELRRLAEAQLAREDPGQTLQPTALVHEAYLRLAKEAKSPVIHDREHFFALACEAMRHILIDNARRKKSLKRGGARKRITLTQEPIAQGQDPHELLALEETLNRLTAHDPRSAKIVALRYYCGLSIEEAADVMNISRAQAYRDWAFARAWLCQQLGEAE
jgi:RNA polymerase sigma factor (TIGR02999 family)